MFSFDKSQKKNIFHPLPLHKFFFQAMFLFMSDLAKWNFENSVQLYADGTFDTSTTCFAQIFVFIGEFCFIKYISLLFTSLSITEELHMNY
jgi:hypothetical protein